MLHITDVHVTEVEELEDRVHVDLRLQGYVTPRAAEELKEASAMHYRGGRAVIDGDAALPVSLIIEILKRENDYCEGRL
jgi:hypothetical protein